MVIPMHILFLYKFKKSKIYQQKLNTFNDRFITFKDLAELKKEKIKLTYILIQFIFLNIKEINAIYYIINIKSYRLKHNRYYYQKMLKKHQKLFDNILGYPLDLEQRKSIINDEWYTLILAGAGSGKTLTMIGKVLYLLQQGIDSKQILVISFTNASVTSFINKIKQYNINIDVCTFHKLGINIINDKGKKVRISPDNTLDKLLCKYNINPNNKKLITTFIHLFKSQNLSSQQFNLYRKKTKLNKSNYQLIQLIEKIYNEYTSYLQQKELIDFDDMINLATNLVDHESFVTKYKYILVDEYQDTSRTKFLFLKKILDITKSKLIAVGDDWQSIYRFTGCELEIFLNFKKNFPYSNIVSINNTYRNSQQLIDIATRFITKNPYQLKKQIVSGKKLDFPVIVYLYNDFNNDLKEVLDEIIINCPNQEILVLGRNNSDLFLIKNDNFKIIEGQGFIYKKKMINFMTVHKSKGLEADNIIVINLANKIDGFPSKIMNHKILSLVSHDHEDYIFDEERRLFYVALTRTKNYVYLLAPTNNISLFVQELMKYRDVKVIKR